MIINGGSLGLLRKNRVDPNRPVIRPEMGPLDWLLEAVALSGLMFFAGYALYHYPNLPHTIPTHFNGSGTADEFGGKESFLILPGTSLFIYVLLTMINRRPYRFNFMVKITKENALRQYTLATRMVRTLKGSLIWLFWFICHMTLQVATGAAQGMGMWFLPVFLGIIFIPLIAYFVLARR